MKSIVKTLILATGTNLFFSCNKDNDASEEDAVIINATGNIQDDIEVFRSMIGPLDTTPEATGGRREINWEGVPDSLLDTPLPNDFFNPTGGDAAASRKKGVTYASATGSFMVSSSGFASVNSQASSQFTAFSGTKTFANTSASQWDIAFQQAGTTQAASVQAFGLVFDDVDKDNSTSVEFFDGNKSLGKYFVPAHDAMSNFSFLGVNFKNNQRVTSVRISHDGFLSEGTKDVSEGGARDLVVLDDFIYSNPVAQ